MFRYSKAAAVVGGLACAGAMALTAPALAAVQHVAVKAPHVVQAGHRDHAFTTYLAGYATENSGSNHYGDNRVIMSLPSQSATGTPLPADTYGGGVALQDSAVSTSTETAGVAWIWDASATVSPVFSGPGNCGPNAYELEYNDVPHTAASYVPLPTSDLVPAQTVDTLHVGYVKPICSSSPDQFIEVAPRAHDWVDFYEGAAWNDAQQVGAVHVPGYNPWNLAGAGIDTALFGGTSVAGDLNTGSVAGITNARVNTNGHNFTYYQYNLVEFEGTLTGGTPSVADPVTLSTSTITPAGNFTISAP
jgi:hypothetical protein